MFGDSINIPEINTVINIPVSEVKSAMNKVCQKCDTTASGVRFKKSDDIFGIYDFFVHIANSWNGFTMGNMKVTINDEGGRTRVKINTVNTGGNYQAINTSALVNAQQGILSSLSDTIRGVESNTVPVSKGAGCLGVALLLIAITLILSIL